MIELLSHYLAHPFFWLTHLFLFIYAMLRISKVNNSLLLESQVISKLKDQSIFFWDNISPNIRSFCSDEDTFNQIKSLNLFDRLLLIYSFLKKGNQDQIMKIIDDYDVEKENELDWLDKIINIFLLTGVVGTLFGLFSSSSRLSDASNLDINGVIKEAFTAFGVTIFAVIYSVIIHIREIYIKNKIKENISTLKSALIPLLSYDLPIEDRPEYEVQKRIMIELNDTLYQLKDSLAAPENMMSTFIELKDLIESIAQNLNKSSRALDVYSENIHKLPDQTENSFKNILAQFEDALRKMEKNVESGINQASQAVHFQKSHLETLEQSTQNLHKEALNQLSDSVRISRELFNNLSNDFTTKLDHMMISSTANMDRLSGLFVQLSNKFDLFMEHLGQASGSMMSFVDNTSSINNQIHTLQQPFVAVEQSIAILGGKLNGFFDQLRFKIENQQNEQFQTLQQGLNKNLILFALFSLFTSLGVSFLQKTDLFMGNSRLELKKEIQIELLKELNLQNLKSEKKASNPQPILNLTQTNTSNKLKCADANQFFQEKAKTKLPQLFTSFTLSPQKKPYPTSCINPEDLMLLKKQDIKIKKFYVYINMQSSANTNTCIMSFTKDPIDLVEFIKNEYEVHHPKVIKDLNHFSIDISCDE
jgi:hypothetical protein